MKNDAANAKSRSRTRKRAEAPATVAAPTPDPAPAASRENIKNVGSIESALSLGLGILLLVGALFPRSIKQLFLLGMGGGLVYRGMTSHCGFYKAVGIDTEKGSLVRQVTDKFLSGSSGENS